MPRSSKHKSSKHSSRDAREYSDSEKESSLRERKSKDENSTRALKESGSGDKRKLDSKGNKEYCDSFNGEYYEEYTSSKRRREKIEDGVNDRWNGGDEDRGESSKKSKISSEKSRKIEEVDGEETKRSTKTDGKHRESSRRENKEIEKEKDRDRDRDRDRKHKEGKHEKFYDGEDHNGLKVASGKTDLNAPGSENYSGKRARRKMDDRGDDDEHQDTIDDAKDRLLSGDNIQDVKQREEKHRDKYQEGIEEEKHRGDKQKDDRLAKEQVRSDDKRFRDEKEASKSKRKKSKGQENNHDHGQEHVHEPDNEHDGYRDRPRDYERSRDYDREYDRSRDRDRDRDRDKDREKERERVRDRRDNERDRFHERDRDRGRSRDRDWDHDRERTRDREKARSRDYYYDRERSKGERDRDFDRDVPHIDDQSGRDKDRRSPDDHDDLSDSKSRTVVGHTDMDIRSSRAQLDGDRIKSQSRQPSSSHGGQDDIGPISDQRSKGISSRDTVDLSGGSERSLKYRASEKTAKMEDGSIGELAAERSSSTKASPRGLVEKSPSSTSNERRYINQSGSRRSLEVEESGQRSYSRDLSAHEERLSRGLPPDKSFGDDTFQAELSFSNKAHQNNSSFQPRPESRGGIGSPLVGSLEEDNRVNIGGRYRRGGDLNMGRGQGNAWRGAPNWPSPVSNGFIPFPHGPPHGGFQSMMPQFPSPSLFGVRPSMEMNHSGIPYHMPDAERFSGHMRPLGWQNMMDGSGPSLMHGWDMNNGVFRDEPHMYGVAEWDHNRRMHSGGWESSADAWKAQNGDANMDVLSMSQKDNQSGQAADDDILTAQTSHSENNRSKSVEAGSNVTSPAKDLPMNSPKVVVEETSDHPVAETMDNAEQCHRYYLSKLDISVELVDAELHSECMNLLMDEQCPIIDGGTTVVINLKDEGKSLPKDDYTTLSTFSLIPAANCSLFQTAIDLYKEQRVEMKSLSTTENEGPQVCPPEADEVSGDVEMDDAKEEDCCIQVSDVGKSNVSDSKASQEIPEAPLYGNAEGTEKHESKPYEVLMEGLPQEAKADDGSEGIVETEETNEKSDRGDDVTATLGPETRESESVVISRIHHSPQSTR